MKFTAFIELLKPITWFPPMWAFICGAITAGTALGGQWEILLLGLLLTGPLVCASSQAVNDWFDRHVDAINEPNRPIPSGRIPGRWGLYLGIIWSILSLVIGAQLGPWGLGASFLVIFFSWAYSMPPVRLKQNGWWGNAACGLAYEGIAWFTGTAVMMGDAMPSKASIMLAVLYSIGAHGIMTLNDFKAIDGDRQMGVRSIPVQLGVRGAAINACSLMLFPQAIIVLILFAWDMPWRALVIASLMLGQGVMMLYFLRDPIKRALFLSGFGVPLFVAGMMLSAFAVSNLN